MVRLERLFELQDEVLREHLNASTSLGDAFRFISDCAWLNAQVLMTMQFGPNKQTAIRKLAVDSLSHTLVAVRVGLWGDLPESLGILRGALESCAQLQTVVREKKYDTAVYEMDRKFEQLSFEKIVRHLGDLGGRFEKIHGQISEIGSHSTGNRLALVSYTHNGQWYDRFGFARDGRFAGLAVFYAMDTCLMVSQSLYEAHVQDGHVFSRCDELDELNRRFRDAQQKLLGEIENLVRNVEATE